MKPITCMKIYNRLSPSVLWMRLLAGCATARYHRIIAGNYVPPEGLDPVATQIGFVRPVASFIRDTDYRPWEMEPDDSIVTSHGGFQEAMAARSTDGTRIAALFFNEEPEEAGGPVVLQTGDGRFEGFWVDPATGERTDVTLESHDGSLAIAPTGGPAAVVLYIRRKA